MAISAVLGAPRPDPMAEPAANPSFMEDIGLDGVVNTIGGLVDPETANIIEKTKDVVNIIGDAYNGKR